MLLNWTFGVWIWIKAGDVDCICWIGDCWNVGDDNKPWLVVNDCPLFVKVADEGIIVWTVPGDDNWPIDWTFVIGTKLTVLVEPVNWLVCKPRDEDVDPGLCCKTFNELNSGDKLGVAIELNTDGDWSAVGTEDK